MAAINPRQAEAFRLHQERLIEGVFEGRENTEADFLFGGLSLEKTKQVIEERALEGKCGNICCKNRLDHVKRNYGKDAVAFLSNGLRVKASELDEYCSETCFNLYQSIVLPKRPAAEVWEMQCNMVQKEESSKRKDASKPAQERDQTGLVKGIKEKEKVTKPKKVFKIGPEPDIDLLSKDKRVTFDEDEADVNDENSDLATTADNEEDDEEEALMASFLDMSLIPDDKIEGSGLSLFAKLWDFLSRVSTESTTATLQSNSVMYWKPSIHDDALENRRGILLKLLSDGVDSCNFSQSDVFQAKAMEEVARLVLTLNLSREIPVYEADLWTLMVCVMLSVLADVGRFRGYDFEKSDILTCFGSMQLSNIDEERFRRLKAVLRPENPVVSENRSNKT